MEIEKKMNITKKIQKKTKSSEVFRGEIQTESHYYHLESLHTRITTDTFNWRNNWRWTRNKACSISSKLWSVPEHAPQIQPPTRNDATLDTFVHRKSFQVCFYQANGFRLGPTMTRCYYIHNSVSLSCATGIHTSPFLRCLNSFSFIGFPVFCDVFWERIIWVWGAQQCLNAQKNSAYLKSWTPLVL